MKTLKKQTLECIDKLIVQYETEVHTSKMCPFCPIYRIIPPGAASHEEWNEGDEGFLTQCAACPNQTLFGLIEPRPASCCDRQSTFRFGHRPVVLKRWKGLLLQLGSKNPKLKTIIQLQEKAEQEWMRKFFISN